MNGGDDDLGTEKEEGHCCWPEGFSTIVDVRLAHYDVEELVCVGGEIVVFGIETDEFVGVFIDPGYYCFAE